jgi:lysophospholipase L1-like esterase
MFCSLVFLSAEIYLYSRNTLVENGRWVSSKVLLQMEPLGAHHFLGTRNALSRNQLHLDSWHGFQEVHFNEVIRPKSIEIKLKINPNAYLCVLMNRNESGYAGIRLSRDPKFKSVFFQANRHGRVVNSVPLRQVQLNDGWHHLKLEYDAASLGVFLDARELAVPQVVPSRDQLFGLRGARGGSAVDRIRVTDTTGAIVLEEDFRNHRDRWRVILFASVLWLALGTAVGVAAARRQGVWRAFFLLFSLQVSLLIVAGAYYLFDFYYWSDQYAYKGATPHGKVGSTLPVAFENLRGKAFATGYDRFRVRERTSQIKLQPSLIRATTSWDRQQITPWKKAHSFSSKSGHVPRFMARDDPNQWGIKADTDTRILFLGTSQTFGTGAEVLTDSFVARTHRKLSFKLSDGKHLETFNFSIPGSGSSALLDQYQRHWLELLPDLLILNLTFNDPYEDLLAANLRLFLQVNRERGIKTVLMIEPNLQPRNGKHGAVDRVGREFGVPVLNLYSHLNSKAIYDSGFLWWDMIHLSSLGQETLAEELVVELEPLVEQLLQR